MDIEEINTDRDKFLTAVSNNVETELKKIGLRLINVNVTDISDESGYISAPVSYTHLDVYKRQHPNIVCRSAGQVAQIVALIAVRQGAQIFAAVAAGNGHSADTARLCQGNSLAFRQYSAVGKLISGDFSVFAHQLCNIFCIFVWNRIHNVDVCGQIADSAVVFLVHADLPFLRAERTISRKLVTENILPLYDFKYTEKWNLQNINSRNEYFKMCIRDR